MHEGDGFHPKTLGKSLFIVKRTGPAIIQPVSKCKLSASPAVARFRRRTFHEPNIILIKAHPSYLIPIPALQHTHQLRSMASTLRMRTNVSPLIGAP